MKNFFITPFFFFLLFFLPSRFVFSIEFTGNAEEDFAPESCLTDSSGKNISLPPSFPANSISGFDVNQTCFVYSRPLDRLYVGVVTFDHAQSGEPIPFGDADGDLDPGATSTLLAAEGGIDYPDLSIAEFFSLIFDFDEDDATPPDVIAGISAERSAPDGFRVSEVALPHLGLDFSFLSAYYGNGLSSPGDSSLYVNPSQAQPHLEFSIGDFSDAPGLSDLDEFDPNEAVTVYFKAGSLADTGIGEEDVRIFSFLLSDFLDTDGDDLPNNFDADIDGDTILNTDEDMLGLADADGDGLPNYLDTDSDNDSIPDSVEAGDSILETPPRDTDSDGIPDFLDPDSDNDGLNDIVEAGLNTDATNPDTDGDGTNDADEQIQGTDPADPSNPDGGDDEDPQTGDSSPSGVSGYPRYQGGGIGGCSLRK